MDLRLKQSDVVVFLAHMSTEKTFITQTTLLSKSRKSWVCGLSLPVILIMMNS